jgi:hypothetical protein
MRTLTFYEQVGVIIPGALFLFGLILSSPVLEEIFVSNNVSIGGLGLFLLISYAAGQLIAALGNIFESVYWFLRGGMPSSWVIGEKACLMSATQIRQIETLAKQLFLVYFRIDNISTKEWKTIFWQIFNAVERAGKTERIDTFNGLYGLNRGLFISTSLLAIPIFESDLSVWALILVICSALLFLVRMDRFAKHYAKEVFVQFLGLRNTSESTQQANP